MTAWIAEQKRVYFGNASSVRDYRAQLRGSRPVLLWSIYLGILILFVLLAYANIVAQGTQSVTVVQSQLKDFYKSILWMLEVMVALIAPVVVTMSIQSEIQRKSIDLVTTSPVSPKYFLVGKVLSGYRYVVMLIFLSLPVSAAAVVLGGATYGEVIIAYFMMAMHGLLYIAISLPIAVSAIKVVPAVIYSYVACWAYAFFASIATLEYLASSWMMGMNDEAPFTTLLAPSMIEVPVDSHTTLLGTQIPNWILASLVILVMVRFMLVAAGSAMTRRGSAETKSLRIHGLVITAVLTAVAAFSQFSTSGLLSTVGGMSGMTSDQAHYLAVFFTVLSLGLVFAMPFLSTWSYVDDHKYRPSGFFSIRQMFTGAPEGGLPYLLALLGTIFAIGLGIWKYYGGVIEPNVVVYATWLVGCWVILWSVGWMVSSSVRSGAGTARKMTIAFIAIVVLLPWPILGMFSTMASADWEEVFKVYPFAGFLYESLEIDAVIFMVFELWLAAIALTIWAESRRKNVVSYYTRAIHAGN